MVRWAVVLGMLLAGVAGSTHVVVPCYNEVERLPRAEFLAYASDPANVDVVFTFVNDGSKDGTLGVLNTLAAAYPQNLFVLDLAKNGGKAEAVRQGINHVMKVRHLLPCVRAVGSSRCSPRDAHQSQLAWYQSRAMGGEFKNNHFTEMCCGTEAGSYLRHIDSCITQLKAQGPSRTCNESKEEDPTQEHSLSDADPSNGWTGLRSGDMLDLERCLVTLVESWLVDGPGSVGRELAGWR